MSTPPPYPFRSRREIHSGEPKVYSDAPQESSDATAAQDSDRTPVHGTPAVASASTDAAPVRGDGHWLITACIRYARPRKWRGDDRRNRVRNDWYALAQACQRTPCGP